MFILTKPIYYEVILKSHNYQSSKSSKILASLLFTFISYSCSFLFFLGLCFYSTASASSIVYTTFGLILLNSITPYSAFSVSSTTLASLIYS